uniref:Uncharacterized protein n=1 Tax=Aegilops tauschii subsp. strangulata TaxID=200361 RepID=A0A453PQY0_AEGTS
ELQKLAMDVLTGMAMDERAKETIVGTGGVVKLLLSIFFNAGECELGNEAGEALAMLALESEASCAAILKRADVLDQLASALDAHDARCLNAMRVLRNLCAYSGEEHRTRLSTVTKAMPTVRAGSHHDRTRQDPGSVRRTHDTDLQVRRHRTVHRRAAPGRLERARLRGAAGRHPAAIQVPGNQSATDAAVRGAADCLAHDELNSPRWRWLCGLAPGARDEAAARGHRRDDVRGGVLPRLLWQRPYRQAPRELLCHRGHRAPAARRRPRHCWCWCWRRKRLLNQTKDCSDAPKWEE